MVAVPDSIRILRLRKPRFSEKKLVKIVFDFLIFGTLTRIKQLE
jgi:hypothetical protein